MNESEIQRGVVSYLRWLEGNTRQFIFTHPANGAHKTKAQAGLFKAMGQRAGIPDLLIFIEGGKTLFIELKSKDGRLSANQKDVHQKLKILGFELHTIAASHTNEALDQIIPILRLNGVRALG